MVVRSRVYRRVSEGVRFVNFKTILFTGFGVVIVAVGIILGVIINTYYNQTQKVNLLVNDRYIKIEHANTIRYEMGTIELESLGEMDEVDPSLIQTMEKAFQTTNQKIVELENLIQIQEAKGILANLSNHYDSFKLSYEEFLVNRDPNLLEIAKEDQSILLGNVEELINFQEEVMQDTLNQTEKDYNAVLKTIIIFGIIGIILTIMIGIIVVHSITKRLRRFKSVLVTLADDDYGYQRVDIQSNDEIGEIAKAYNELVATLEKQEQIEKDYRVKIENQNWLKTRFAELSVLTQGVNNLQVAGERHIQKIAKTIGANYGVLYVVKNEEEETYLEKLSSYAYSSTSQHENTGRDRIYIGEGLVGQCAKTKELILLENITDDYIKISSGLGSSKPMNIIIVPIVLEDELLGVMELATLETFTALHQDFLQQSNEMLGITFSRIYRHIQVEELLSESQILNEELQTQSEELQMQQEELRTMNDEVEAQYRSAETKTKELEEIKENLELKTQEIIMSSKYKSEFMANMSHELRTPLNSLLILSQMMMENKEQNLTNQQLEYVNTIFTSGHDLLQLINDILDLSKIESGKMEIVEGEVLINDIIHSLHRQFMPVAKNKEISFTFTQDPDLPDIIYTDEHRVNQILKNLLSNAFKFTERGHVQVNISRTTRQDQMYIAFSIIDTGIGIAKDKLSAIFEAFTQADGTTSRKYGGTGLGLSISQELAKLINGFVSCESIEKEGSTFTLYIPLGEEDKQEELEQSVTVSIPVETMDAGENEVATAQEQPLLMGKRVLVVDDDMRNIFALTSSLEAAGMEVTFAENGKEAIKKLQEQKETDIVLMDIMMPEMDGYEAMRVIKSMKEYENLPIIALTAKAMKDDRQKCMDAGASDYISKPVNLDQLFSIIRVWLHH
ncbi:response regulator [Bacillus sp. BGMRC 2118]|nr:response regulator [Bacillus sp. BGMRC 2118]